MENCKTCKGRGKILLLISEVDCDCVILEKIIDAVDLKSGEIGYEEPPTDIPYLIRFKNDFIYADGCDDSEFETLTLNDFDEDNWPPDFSACGAPAKLKIIAKNVKSLDEAKNIIRQHEEKHARKM